MVIKIFIASVFLFCFGCCASTSTSADPMIATKKINFIYQHILCPLTKPVPPFAVWWCTTFFGRQKETDNSNSHIFFLIDFPFYRLFECILNIFILKVFAHNLCAVELHCNWNLFLRAVIIQLCASFLRIYFIYILYKCSTICRDRWWNGAFYFNQFQYNILPIHLIEIYLHISRVDNRIESWPWSRIL